jgi:hypothetical protein
MTVPTVDQVLAKARITHGQCQWGANGGAIGIPEAELRQALEDAYDPLMPDWPAMVELDS